MVRHAGHVPTTVWRTGIKGTRGARRLLATRLASWASALLAPAAAALLYALLTLRSAAESE